MSAETRRMIAFRVTEEEAAQLKAIQDRIFEDAQNPKTRTNLPSQDETVRICIAREYERLFGPAAAA